jgi:4-hydroxy-3-polyprenylbenzoate decarboxylase
MVDRTTGAKAREVNMTSKTLLADASVAFSRREIISSGLGVAALGLASAEPAAAAARARKTASTRAPFDSLRDYIRALEERGLVVRIPRVDQDAYEATALLYRFRDQHGMRGAPALVFEEIRIGGRWVRGPLIVNESGHLWSECLAFGLEPADDGPLVKESFASYRKARAHVEQMLAANAGRYPEIPPQEVARAEAPCKEITLTGDDIDLTAFQFIKCNPSDAGRYINTGMVFTRHPEYGVNFGTYRCHLRGPREIGVNSEPGQTGNRHLTAARDRGEKIARVSIALSPDPYVWTVSSNKLADRKDGPVDELAIAGGLAGRPVKVVRSETNDFLVPATAEMIIEGEIPLDDMRPEGPYGEMVGYQGQRKERQFWMRVTAVTHRKNPWIMNNFTGLQAGSLMAPGHARPFRVLKEEIPAVVDFYSDNRTVGVTFVSIRKARPGQGLEIARQIAERNFFAKVVVVVDDDLDVTNQEQMVAALGARWQPYGSSHVYEALPGMPLDPSATQRGRTSKIAIDATRKWPEEGGPARFPELNETLLKEGAPKAFELVDQKWADFIRNWQAG